MILTHYQAKQLLEAKEKGLKEIEISLDLNKTLTKIKIQNDLFIFPDSQKLEAHELYSLDFYKQLFRVLKKDDKLYHYIGSPGSKFRKIDLAKNVANRLRSVGFKDIKKVHYGLRIRE